LAKFVKIDASFVILRYESGLKDLSYDEQNSSFFGVPIEDLFPEFNFLLIRRATMKK